MKKPALLITIIAGIALLGFGAWHFLEFSSTYSGKPEPIVVGEKPYEANALVYIAQDRGFFAGNGLGVATRTYPSVTEALGGLLNGEVELGLSSEYAVAGRLCSKQNISIVGTIDRFETLYLICRKDKGIRNISDLKGKRVGLTRKAIGEFYLGRFLALNGMDIQDVTVLDTPPVQQVEALTSGSVDALVVAEIIDTLRERFGEALVVWPVQSSQSGYIVVSGRSDWVAGRPETIKKFLKSLVQAEQYALVHPAESKAIVQNRLRCDEAYVARIWPKHRFALSLDQTLIMAMKDEAQWMINNGFTAEHKIPDFLNSIYEDGLTAVKPEAVNIIR